MDIVCVRMLSLQRTRVRARSLSLIICVSLCEYQ